MLLNHYDDKFLDRYQISVDYQFIGEYTLQECSSISQHNEQEVLS